MYNTPFIHKKFMFPRRSKKLNASERSCVQLPMYGGWCRKAKSANGISTDLVWIAAQNFDKVAIHIDIITYQVTIINIATFHYLLKRYTYTCF